VADSINVDNNKAKVSSITNAINTLYKYHDVPFTKPNWRYASTYEIGKIINSIKSEISYGYDEIPNCIIKLSSPFIISPLTHICNAVLSSGVFPDRLKYDRVKLLFRKDSKQDISNYRPISLLNSFSKNL
jgi:hypothetical protein